MHVCDEAFAAGHAEQHVTGPWLSWVPRKIVHKADRLCRRVKHSDTAKQSGAECTTGRHTVEMHGACVQAWGGVGWWGGGGAAGGEGKGAAGGGEGKGAAGAHCGGEEGLAGRVGRKVQHGVGGLLGGQCKGGKGVHDQVEPEHLNRCQRGLLECNRAYACRADRHNIHRQLQQT